MDRKAEEKTDEENNGLSGVLKGDWVIYVKSGRRHEGRAEQKKEWPPTRRKLLSY